MDYIITTDSNSDVPSEVLNQYGIPVIPQYYAFGDVVYGDEKNMTPKEFYETMRKGDLPKSMANNPAVIREKFETILKKGKDILHIAFSSALTLRLERGYPFIGRLNSERQGSAWTRSAKY